MSRTDSEEQVLQHEVARLESEGYDVFLQPRAALVPEFLGDHVPDAVATGNGKKIVLEVVRSSNAENDRLKEVAARSRFDSWRATATCSGSPGRRLTAPIAKPVAYPFTSYCLDRWSPICTSIATASG
ncbi:MAG: hypothetical protein JOZ74_06045 [Bradyrhizobium sp.]|nr:hypothetical protein [Bradyrhizobium sp.]